MEAHFLPGEGDTTCAGLSDQAESARVTRAVEDVSRKELEAPGDKNYTHPEGQDNIGITMETIDQQAGGEELEVPMEDDGRAGTELPTSTITTNMMEEDGEGGIKVEEEEVEKEILAQDTPQWEGYSVPELEEEQTTAEQLEEEQTTAEQLEEEQTTAEQLEEEQTTAEQLEEEQTTAEQLEEEQTTAEQLEEEQTTAEQLEEEQTTAEQLEEEQTTAEHLEEEQMKSLHDLQTERDKLHQRNSQMQLILLQHFRRKASDLSPAPEPRPVHGLEQHYLKLLDTIEDLKQQQRHDSELHLTQLVELQHQSQEKVEQLEQEWRILVEGRRGAFMAAFTSTLGKQAALAQAERLGVSAQKREEDLTAVRLKNIKLKMKVQKLEATLKEEELDEGMNVIDFEQLKIENHTYSEKIEERNEELLKLRKKISSTVQVLSHVKEKLQFVQVENQAKRGRLVQVEAAVARRRDVLTRTKQVRDALRANNLRLRQRCGMLGNATLLRDLEEKVEACSILQEQLDMLKRRHTELSVRGTGVQAKVANSNTHTHALMHTH